MCEPFGIASFAALFGLLICFCQVKLATKFKKKKQKDVK